MKRVTLKIPDMHCSACVMRLEALEERLPGIRQIEGSYQRQTLTVDFDDSQVDEETIRAAVRQAGYTPA